MAKLVFIGEKFSGRLYEITAQRTTVGRADSNTLSLHDSSVSERHCEIYDNGADVIVRDLGSRNGTSVNGELLRDAQRPLAHGQIVKFGAVEARLEISWSSTSDTNTDVTAIHFHAREVAQPHPHQPAAPPVTLDDGAPPDSNDHTLVLPRPTASPASISPAPLAPVEKPASKTKLIAILVALVIGLALWLILRR